MSTNGHTPPRPHVAFEAYHDARLVGPNGKPVGGQPGMIRILRDEKPAGVIDVSGDPEHWIVTIYPQGPEHPPVCARVRGQAEAEDMVRALLIVEQTPAPRAAR